MKVGIEPASRIIFSASAFNSSVEIPGSTISRKASRTSAISSPTARIFSMSFCDFAMIILLPNKNSTTDDTENTEVIRFFFLAFSVTSVHSVVQIRFTMSR